MNLRTITSIITMEDKDTGINYRATIVQYNSYREVRDVEMYQYQGTGFSGWNFLRRQDPIYIEVCEYLLGPYKIAEGGSGVVDAAPNK